MIRQIRNSVLNNLLWGLMGIYLLNLSIDAADLKPQNFSEDLSFNDQESIVEIFVEKILGFENVIEEYDDHDTENHNTKTIDKFDLIVAFSIEFIIHQLDYDPTRQLCFNFNANLTTGFFQLNSPPPKFF